MDGLTAPAALIPNAGAESPAKDAKLAAIHKTAKEFESFFMAQMVAHMFEGVGKDPLFGGGPGEDVYRSFLYDEYGKMLAAKGGIGIADSMVRQMLRHQESQP